MHSQSYLEGPYREERNGDRTRLAQDAFLAVGGLAVVVFIIRVLLGA